MPCITDITEGEIASHYKVMLCKACKMLKKHQIMALTNPGAGIHDGLDWYKGHLMEDYLFSKNSEHEKQLALKELNRLGFTVDEKKPGCFEVNDFVFKYPY